MYACGPTVYDNPHVGNARTLVVFDTLLRVLKMLYGNNVTYVRNITDVDDKIIDISKIKNKPIENITTEITKIFHDDCKSLNCLKPTIEPKATEHIKEMILMITSLINKKLNVFYEDAFNFIDNSKSLYDLVIADRPDPIGAAKSLYKSNFYKSLNSRKKYQKQLEAHNNKFNETIYFESVYNRLIIFNSNDFHGVKNFKIGSEPRLTFITFIKWLSDDNLKSGEIAR